MNRIEAITLTHDLFHLLISKYSTLLRTGAMKEEELRGYFYGAFSAAAYFLRFLKFQIGDNVEMSKFLKRIFDEQWKLFESHQENHGGKLN